MRSCCDMRGFLTFTVLRLVRKKPMSGEGIRRELAVRKGSKPSPGTVYPVLKSMSESGWIMEVRTKSNGGRKEKRYRITATGKRELAAATRKFIAIFCDMKGEFERLSVRK